MSYIDKLMILGVRAFPVDHGCTIEFGKPLTLVAGINGSGKTTIIESLKFVATGGLPPGASLKGAWIHDPGLQGDKKVMAQVRLLFHAANGTRLVAIRSLQLDVKKSVRSQKTAECSLSITRHGQQTTLSTRVAELDQQIPLYLGVSQSLIENVLFCHQEDSAWPLAESSVLKKKFDDIFEAGKYTNAVKELLNIRKKHRLDLGRQQELANGAKKDRDRARKVSKQMQKLYDECDELREQAKDMDEKIKAAQSEADDLNNQAQTFNDILVKLGTYREKANLSEQVLNELRAHMKEAPEGNDWLEAALEKFDATLVRYNEEKKNKKDEYLEREDEHKSLKKQLDDQLTLRGQYEEEKRAYEQRLEGRKQRIKEAAAKHQIRGFNDLDDDDKVLEFLFKIRKLSKERGSKAEKSRAEADAQKRSAQVQINQLTEREKVLRDNKINHNKQIALNNREADQKQTEANAINVDEGNKAVAESRIEELRIRVQSTQETSISANFPAKIKQIDTELTSLKTDLKRLNDELFQATTRASEVAQLSHVKQELKEKAHSLNTLKYAHNDRIASILGNTWTTSNLETSYKSRSANATQAVSTAEKERDGLFFESEQLQFKQKTARDEIDARKKQAQQYENVVRKAIDDDIAGYEEAHKSAEVRLEQAQDTARNVGGLAAWFEKVLETAESRHACRLCERAFKSPEDPALTRFKKKLEGLVQRSASEAAEQELKDATEDHKRVMEAAGSYENWKRLTSTEIPNLERELAKLGRDHETLLQKIEQRDGTVQDVQSAQKEVESISHIVASMVKTEQDVQALQSKLDSLTEKQSQQGLVRSLEDIREEIDTVDGRIQEHEKTRSRLIEEQDTARAEMHAMELELREQQNGLGTISRRLDQKAALLSRVEEYKVQNQKQKEDIERINTELDKIKPEIETANARYEDIERRTEADHKELSDDAASLADSVNRLELLTSEIQSYIDSAGDKKLTKSVQQIEKIRQNMTKLEALMTTLTKEIHQLDEQLRDSENTRRHYADNLRYRKELHELKWLRAEIEEIEAKNAEADRDQLQRMADQKLREKQNFAAQRGGVVGELKSKDVQLKELIEEYNLELKDAAARFREAHVKVESTKAAIEDIGKYSTALDQAVTKYHTLKMDQVNAIIDELWRATYQGSDVDTIFIKSDLEVKANTRSHNYRVVMLKRDIELDMRGRCSAGQKVLASIIIRLALAECFSRDCGVIALDEPTTNLDEKNVGALASSLHRIIENRQRQSNFQLVIITHDENFIRQMHCEDFTDVYYLVRRDSNDDSVIQRQKLANVVNK